MIRPFFLLCTFLVALLACPAVSIATPDIQDENPNHKQVNQLLDSSISKRNVSLLESITLCQEAIELAEEIDDPKILSLAYKTQGVNYFFQGNSDSSFLYYNKAIPKFEAIGDQVQVGKVLGNIGLLYKRSMKYDQALEYYIKNLRIFEKVNYEKGLGSVLNNIGNLHYNNDDLVNAEKNYQLALINFKKFNITKELANVYCNLGAIYEKRKDFPKSHTYYSQSLSENKKLGNKLFESKLIYNIGYLHHMQGNLDSAYLEVKKSEEIRLALGNHEGVVGAKLELARILTEQKKYQKAESYFLEAYKLALQHDYIKWRSEILFHMTEYYEQVGNFKKAFQYQSEYISVNDSIQTNEIDERFDNMIVAYETEKREKELELLHQRTQIQKLELGKKNAWIITLLVVMLLGIVAVLVSLRINRLRADHKIMDLRQKVLLTQMNPHFLFNSLTAIQSFILDNKNMDANNYLSRLASLVRGILENSREEFVSLNTELSTLEDYIEMQKLRFDNEIQYDFIIDKNINLNEVMVPPMLAQPFVENALIHGKLRNNPNAKITIQVNLLEKEGVLEFQILDNGIGIEESKKESFQKNHKSLATSIALDRVKIYNFKSSKKMKFKIIDLKNNKAEQSGTQVSYTIPVKQNIKH